MNNTKYEQLKSVIQKVNPEIMKWQFGCEIKAPDGFYTLIQKSEVERVFHAFQKDYGIDYVDLGHCDIYGRPIRLADVLSVAHGKTYIVMVNELLLARKWNLKDDNLDHQSDETKQFLIDLLVS